MKSLLLYVLVLSPIAASPRLQGDTNKSGYKTEGVKISYALLLNRCIANSCHVENVGHRDAYINLSAENRPFSWGYGTMNEHAGNVEYQLRFDVSRTLKGEQFERKLAIGFSGRTSTLAVKQVTSSQKEFTGKNCDSLRKPSISGKSYTEESETITPTLQILQIKIFP